MAKAILIVDMLNDFVKKDEKYQGKLVVEGAKNIVENIGKIKGKAEEYNVLVVYANDWHEKDDPEFKVWPEHALKNTYGAEIVDIIKPNEYNLLIKKQDLSVFTNKDVDKILSGKNVDELYVTGVATEYCVRAATLDALTKNYKVNVVVDAIAGVDEIVLPDGNIVPETKGAVNRALLEMGNKGAKPIYTANVLEELVK